MSEDPDNVQRSLGRIEGMLQGVGNKLDKLSGDFMAHTEQDRENFSGVHKLVYEQRDILAKQFHAEFTAQADARNQHLNEQDVKLDNLAATKNFAKGVSWTVMGLLGSAGAIIVSVITAALTGWLHIG